MELTIIGFVLGIIASMLAWWILTHGFVPKIKFASILSKVETINKGNYKYRIGIKNVGIRDIIDVSIYFELLIKGFDLEIPTNTDHIPIGLRKNSIPRITSGNRWAIDIDLEKIPDYFKSRIKNHDTLEQIMNFDDCKARIIVMGYDKFSGSRKVFVSKEYTLEDIIEDKIKQEYYK